MIFAVQPFSRSATAGVASRTSCRRIGHEVVGELELLVVREEDEAVGCDRRVRREQEPDVDLAVLDGLDRDRAARVERLELLEREAVGLLQAHGAERALRALGRPAEHEGARERRPGWAGGRALRRSRRCGCRGRGRRRWAAPTRRAGANDQRQQRRPEGSPADGPHGSSFLCPRSPDGREGQPYQRSVIRPFPGPSSATYMPNPARGAVSSGIEAAATPGVDVQCSMVVKVRSVTTASRPTRMAPATRRAVPSGPRRAKPSTM